MNPFLQLTAEKKDSKNGAARKFFDPSYFLTALVHDRGSMYSVSGLHHDPLFMKFVSFTIDSAEVVKFGIKELPGGIIWH